jgi:hypothetical protein
MDKRTGKTPGVKCNVPISPDGIAVLVESAVGKVIVIDANE